MGTKPAHVLIRRLLETDPRNRIECREAIKLEVFQELKQQQKLKLNSGKENVGNKDNQGLPSNIDDKNDGRPIHIQTEQKLESIKADMKLRLKSEVSTESGKESKERIEARKSASKIVKTLEFSNPKTVDAALTYWDCAQQPIEYCVLLAHKMHEQDLMNIEEVEEYLENFDIDEYSAAEELMFQKMGYDLT